MHREDAKIATAAAADELAIHHYDCRGDDEAIESPRRVEKAQLGFYVTKSDGARFSTFSFSIIFALFLRMFLLE